MIARMSRNPAVWRTAVTSIVAALVAAGILSPDLGDKVNTWAGVAVIVVTALLPIVGAIWGKGRTVPVVKGTPDAPVLVRDQTTGVYQQADVIPPTDGGTRLQAPGSLSP